MPFSISSIPKHIISEIENPPLYFGKIHRNLAEIQKNIAKLLLGVNAEQFTFDRFDDSADQEETLDFSIIPSIQESKRARGANLLNQIAHGIAVRLENKMNDVSRHNPAILTIAYEIAAHVGITEFNELANHVANDSGIFLKYEPKKSIDISVSRDGIIRVQRHDQWYESIIDKKPAGEVLATWVLSCIIAKDKNGHLFLFGSITEIGLFISDNQLNEKEEIPSHRLQEKLTPSIFNNFINRFKERIHSMPEQMEFIKKDDINIYYVNTKSLKKNKLQTSKTSHWHGWEAIQDKAKPQLQLDKTSPNTAHISRDRFRIFDSDHRMAWKSASSQQYLEKKLVFQYSDENLSTQKKLEEEDAFALDVLESKSTKEVVIEISQQLARFLENTVDNKKRDAFINVFHNFIFKRVKAYPFPITKIQSFEELINLLNNEKNHITLLAFLWPIFSKKIPIEYETDEIENIYKNKIFETKFYNVNLSVEYKIYNNTFGNSKTISSEIFNSNHFLYFQRSIDYISKKNNSTNRIIKRMEKNNTPYISGLSGMANMTCKILHVLDIHPQSDQGIKFFQAMSAFIVGSGMHSYYEVYKAFNIYSRTFDQDIKSGFFVKK